MIETILDYAVNYGKENFLEILLTIAMIYNLLKGNHATAESIKEIKKKNKAQKQVEKLNAKQDKEKAKATIRHEKIERLKEQINAESDNET